MIQLSHSHCKMFVAFSLVGSLLLLGCRQENSTVTTRTPETPDSADVDLIRIKPLRPGIASGKFQRLSPDQTKLDFVNRVYPNHPMKRLYHSGFICGGVAIGDVDGDGRPDVFCANGPDANRLFRQVDDFQFQDVSEQAGIGGGSAWGAGAALKDIDNDGDLDLYVCNYESPNQLFINDGHGRFTERAAEFGLDVVNSSLMAAFCDYDCDGDLDVYILTNRIYQAGGRPNQPPFRMVNGKPEVLPEFAKYYTIKEKSPGKFGMDDYGQPDLLLENRNGKFVDVTEPAGIAGLGYGLSVTWWDYNLDGYPDLYVSNDFNDPDAFYRNNGDGTFTNILTEALPHTPWFSMGSDFGDLNNDGWFDYLAVDMSATNHFGQKTTMGAMSADKLAMVAGPPPQIMRNALYVNTGTDRFQEAAYLAGLADSDWSWAVKIADLDCDGWQDVFVTNGMIRSFNNSDIDFHESMLIGNERWELYANTPTRPEQNLVFQNQGDWQFINQSVVWGLDHVGMSYSATYGDLDRDGDLDLIVVNADEPVSVYRNDVTSLESDAHRRLLVQLHGTVSNRQGLGAIVTVRTNGQILRKQLLPSSGFLSDNEGLLQFGLGAANEIDSIEVQWPSGIRHSFADVPVNSLVQISERKPTGGETPQKRRIEPQVAQERLFVPFEMPTEMRHEETYFDDFQLQPLLPNQLSQFGPGLAVGDVNGDQTPDLFLSGSAGRPGQIWLNSDGGWKRAQQPDLQADAVAEDMGAVLVDVDADDDLDLYVVSGSVENHANPNAFQDRLYLNDGAGHFQKTTDHLPEMLDSGSCVLAADFDRDGDLDLFVGGRLRPGDYPLSPQSHLLQNDGHGKFMDVTSEMGKGLTSPGMVTSGVWSDVDRDGWIDLLLTVEWGPVRYFQNQQGKLRWSERATSAWRIAPGWAGTALRLAIWMKTETSITWSPTLG
ncbi:MAG: VCBS repeat-containing protein [Pirellulaceae bacterium]